MRSTKSVKERAYACISVHSTDDAAQAPNRSTTRARERLVPQVRQYPLGQTLKPAHDFGPFLHQIPRLAQVRGQVEQRQIGLSPSI